MSQTTVLLTGAAGKVGRYVTPRLLDKGYRVYATDQLERPEELQRSAAVDYIRCDLTDAAAVMDLLAQSRPTVVVHTAAIVAPISFSCTELARRVNLDATENLLSALAEYAPQAHFVFCSSYTVHGPCAPGAPRWGGDTPYAPADDYTHHKVAAERRLREQAAGWTILRIGGVFDAEVLMPKHHSYKAFAFMVPLAQREHGVDVQDVVTALVNSASVKPLNRILMIGGDASWQKTATEIRGDLFRAMGLSDPDPSAYRQPPDPDCNRGWYAENWMDTTEAQELLQFQNHRYEHFLMRVRSKSRWIRWLGPIMRRLAGPRLLKDSPYLGEAAITAGESLWDDIKVVYGIDDSALAPPFETPSLAEAV